MAAREREGLIAKIRQVRRAAAPSQAPNPRTADLAGDQLRGLETRIEHLEQLVQGLQDSVHRESSRHAKLIADLETRVQPEALGKALSEDARLRGL